ncbi:MAE_28990/MAE_18760 family HEPN-like nuclease [Clostridium paraputrificum]|uniref:MAE_28990/MAE_18760 family HEPN-like nuclease n=1 Tax=Clostridium paraputrificum TaxID=29363 RepID=UPI0034A498CE
MSLYESLEQEIEWRIFELAILKTNHLSSNLSELRKNIIRKYSVISIYALYEGFVVEAFNIYKEQINLLKIPPNKLNTRIITYFMDNKYKLYEERSNFEKREQLTRELENIFFSNNIELNVKINTESNVNIKVLNKLLYSFNLETVEDSRLKDKVNKLLKFRNSLAHGEVVLKVTDDLIYEFTDTVTVLMDLIAERILDGYKRRTYLR